MMDDPYQWQFASPRTDNQSASVVQIDSGKLVPLVVFLAIIAGIAIGMAIYAISASSRADREARMLEYYLLELDAKFINAGLKDPADSIASKLKEQREKAR